MRAIKLWTAPLSNLPADGSIFINIAAIPETKRSASLIESSIVCKSFETIGTGAGPAVSILMLDKKRFTSQLSVDPFAAETSVGALVAVAVGVAPSSGVVFVGSLAMTVILNQLVSRNLR